MALQYQTKLPNTEKLFHYLDRSQWHNVSPSFSRFSRVEIDENLKKFEIDPENFKNLKQLVEFCEVGNFIEGKSLIVPAHREYKELVDILNSSKSFPRQGGQQPRYADQRDRGSPKGPTMKQDYRDGPHVSQANRRDGSHMSPANREGPPMSPANREDGPHMSPANRGDEPHMSPANRGGPYMSQSNHGGPPMSPVNRGDGPHMSPSNRGGPPMSPANRSELPQQPSNRNGPPSSPRNLGDQVLQQTNRDGPLTDRAGQPMTQGHRAGPQTPHYHGVTERSPRASIEDDAAYMSNAQSQKQQQQPYDAHRANYDSLRLNSPQKPIESDYPMARYSNAPNSRLGSERPDHKQHEEMHRSVRGFDQRASHKELWGQDYGDAAEDKFGNSTYRKEYPEYRIENLERPDKERYRDNFGSLAERSSWARQTEADETNYKDDLKKHLSSKDTPPPEFDNRLTELARRFKECYNTEWRDAYDEICKVLGSEKTVKHLLWVVTEAYLIADDTADLQLKDLERQAFGVMTTPGGHDLPHDAWLSAQEIAHQQLQHLERSALGVMSSTDWEHRSGSHAPRSLGEAVPTSRGLLLTYRKQTAKLSIPSVIEECRDKICKTLTEPPGFLKMFTNDTSRLVAYINKCAELVWLMTVQDPPVVLEYITRETEGGRFNHDHYTVYNRQGTSYDYGVWPMLRLGRKGPIISKGIAQAI